MNLSRMDLQQTLVPEVSENMVVDNDFDINQYPNLNDPNMDD